MVYEEDTIVAISTPPGTGGISIIRISGRDSIAIANTIFCVANPTLKDLVKGMKSHTIKYGFIKDPITNEIIDECMLTRMDGPSTYTREDIIEINCHGSYAVMTRIVALILSLGARSAQGGEFTKRAFLNGRIDLSKAEAVLDLINSQTDLARKAAISQLEGKLSKQLKEIRQKLISILGEIEVNIDYPEYDGENFALASSMDVLKEAKEELEKLSSSYMRGKLIREGIKITIAGKPNVGKSSLMNILVGHNRAIVSEIPGTTRDTIEEFIEIDGIPIVLTDTAGIRDTQDPVEKIGVKKAEDKIEEADLIIYIVDSSQPEIDKKVLRKDKPVLVVINKIDIGQEQIESIKDDLQGYDYIESSFTKEIGIEEIYKKIKEYFLKEDIVIGGENIITNARHKELIDKSKAAIERALSNYQAGLFLDCIVFDIWEGANLLAEISGESVNAEVIDNIFSRFCLGK